MPSQNLPSVISDIENIYSEIGPSSKLSLNEDVYVNMNVGSHIYTNLLANSEPVPIYANLDIEPVPIYANLEIEPEPIDNVLAPANEPFFNIPFYGAFYNLFSRTFFF